MSERVREGGRVVCELVVGGMKGGMRNGYMGVAANESSFTQVRRKSRVALTLPRVNYLSFAPRVIVAYYLRVPR